VFLGSILGPLLFVLFLTALVHHLKHSQFVKYPDDTVIFFGSKDINVIEDHLNEDLAD